MERIEGPVVVSGEWNGTEGALQIAAQKPTIKFVGGAEAANQSWLAHVGQVGDGNLVFFRQGDAPDQWLDVLTLSSSGNVGVGTGAPVAPMDVRGDWTGVEGALRVSGNKPTIKFVGGPDAGSQTWILHVGSDGGGNLQFYRQGGAPDEWTKVLELTSDGSLGIPGDIRLAGADYAEEFPVVDHEQVDPGTVVVLDGSGSIRPCRSAYDRRVAGVVSGAGGYRPALIMDHDRDDGARRPVALMGKVYCKVDADRRPVGPGDLLTTSEVSGHAMRADERTLATGTVLGKAMDVLSTGRGLIPVLVNLQ